MKKKKKTNKTKVNKGPNAINILKAVKAQQRKEEIMMFGRLINYATLHVNKKKYTRKQKHKKKDLE